MIEELDGELLVYDQQNHRAHCLSASAAEVWRTCDGNSSPDHLGVALGLDADTVGRALDELMSCGLLDTEARVTTGSTRREVAIRAARAGVAVAAAPLIVSVAAPSAAQAATVAFCASACPSPCNSGNCGSCCTTAFAGCGCCNCGGNPKFCTPLGPPGNQNQVCIALHGAGCNITCTGG